MDDCRCCDNFSGDVSAGNMGRKTEGGRKKSILQKLQAEQQMAEAKNTQEKNGTTAEKK